MDPPSSRAWTSHPTRRRPGTREPALSMPTFTDRMRAEVERMKLPEAAGPGQPWRPVNWLARQTGMASTVLSRLLEGQTKPRIDHVEVLAWAFGVEPAYLAFGVGKRAKAWKEKPGFEPTLRGRLGGRLRAAESESVGGVVPGPTRVPGANGVA